MKTNRIPARLWVGLLALGAAWNAPAQDVTLQGGSDGSDGSLNVTEDTTVPLPADGILNYTTVTIADGATLRFSKNARNTPVFLLATGVITVNANGAIDVSGALGSQFAAGVGGPGGFDGGRPGFGSDSPPGAGFGPGGGGGGTLSDINTAGAGGGAFGSRPRQENTSSGKSAQHGLTYGNQLLRPMIGGSGGGGAAGQPGLGGGGGGGAILLGSAVGITVNGVIRADGGASANRNSVDNGGSGGGIRLVAPVVGGTGLISAFGGDNDSVDTGSNYSGGGRIRVDAFDLAGLNGITFSPLGNTTAGSSVFVFPNPRPSLDIVSAAGQAIAEGEQGPVRINLPFNSPTTQQVTLRASNFGGVVPVSVLVTPVHGNPTEFQGEIDNSADNPAEVTLDVTIPTNVQVVLQAWTR